MEARRSGNYEASIWDDDYVQSLTTPYMVKIIIDKTEDQLDQLELIDNLQKLDISNHFEDGIRKILETIYYQTVKYEDKHMEKDLHVTALQFRLLRQHGYHVPQEVFCSFLDEAGNFKASLPSDVKGILSLYEASFLSLEGENILDLAKDFSTHHLRDRLHQITNDPSLAEQIRHALELPLHWRVQKIEAKWFINVYETRFDANLILLELAKLDFNIVQAKYQDEIKHMSRWYKETGLPEKLGFARHRLAECFLWAVGFTPEHHFGYSREILTKIAVLITIMDDIYDAFMWAELSRAYYLEARWFHSGYFPSTNEYLNTAWVSISGPVLLFHAYFSITNPINMKDLRGLEQYPGIIRWPSMVLRLADDLGTTSDEMKKGDVPKSIQCYMNETECSEEDAHEYIKHLIDVTLKRMNKDILMEKPFKGFGKTAMNLARISLCIYQYGDGFGVPHHETKNNLVSLIVEPISMP
ncbi:hypothetical protein DH2020_042248 [Rehmannia glutinosa]|uniref:Uncharacterized protein n=1 Tax=Rehmannia glutinosa TaxID=99300 RepID=A0ABR0UPB3_REHGL